MRRSAAFVVIGALLLLAGRVDAGAQTFTGSVRGEVKDANGILPGATVTLVNEATNVSRDTVTNEVGQYAFPAVTPGTYTVKVSLTGYKVHERKGLTIATQQQVALDVALELGTIQESITVTGESPLIETATASTGAVIDEKALAMLPAPGRAAYLMAVTVPTVVATGDAQFNRQQDQTNASLISMGGGPRRGNNYLLDGLPITDMRNRSVVNPIIEAVDEVKVQVHTYDTEMGRTGGGIFNVAMKSGTNSYRGSGFFQTRPSGLLTQNFFRSGAATRTRRSTIASTAAASAVRSCRDRTFFWGALEGYRSSTTRNGEIRFPTSLERAGNFSRSPVIIYDPLTTDANGNRQPFPGNTIPANRISPVARNILGYVPLPDSEVNDGNPNYSRTAQIVDAADQFTGKVEHKFSDKVSLSGVYVYNKTDEPHSVFWDDNLFGSPSWLLNRRIHVLAVNNTWIPSDSTVVTFRGGWNRFDDNCSVPNDFDPGTLGFNNAFVSDIQFDKFPRIDPEGYGGDDGFAGWCPRNDIQWYTYAFNGTITKLVGRHSLKAGAEFQHKGLNTQIFGQSSGRFEFTQSMTGGPNAFNPGGSTGDAIASMLLGYPLDYNEGNFAVISNPTEVFFRYFGGFVQDDFRLSNKLTLTYGLRFEHEQGLQEAENRMVVAFDENATSPLDGLVNKAGTPLAGRTLRGGLVYAGQNGAPNHQGDPAALKVAPRLGVVYAISPRTVIRGGYGLFYAPWNYPFPSEENYGQRGYTQVTSLQQTFPRPITTLDNPFPNGLDPVTGNSAGLLTGVGGTVRYIDQNKQDPRVQQWSFDVQRELPGNMALTIGYLGQPRRQARPRRGERRRDQHQPARSGPAVDGVRIARRGPQSLLRRGRGGRSGVAADNRARTAAAAVPAVPRRAGAPVHAGQVPLQRADVPARQARLERMGRPVRVHLQPAEGQPVRRDELLHGPGRLGAAEQLQHRRGVLARDPRRAAQDQRGADRRAPVRTGQEVPEQPRGCRRDSGRLVHLGDRHVRKRVPGGHRPDPEQRVRRDVDQRQRAAAAERWFRRCGQSGQYYRPAGRGPERQPVP